MNNLPNDAGKMLPIPLGEFVCIVAALMSLNALAIDIMLPALGVIADFYQLQTANDQQWVLFAFIAGAGVPQLVFGPLSDHFGRRGILIFCLLGYLATAFISMGVNSFSTLLALRFSQGVLASGIRVVAVSIVRDLLAGRSMARVMSLVLTVFMIVPILAPAIGQIIMTITDWRWIFGVLGLCGILTLIWVQFRLPETLSPESQKDLNFSSSFKVYVEVLKVRATLGYMAASGVIFGALFAFLGASEQIFSETFNQGDRFAIWFAIIGAALAIANIFNARIVEKFGMRRVSHTVLFVFTGLSLVNPVLLQIFGERFEIFYPLFALTFASFGMLGANFSAIAMEPQGNNVGPASAAYGFATTTISLGFGWLVAQQFNGSAIPVLYGFAGLGLMSLVIVWVTEKGELFEPVQR